MVLYSILTGGAGDDTLNGGGGNDTMSFADASGVVTFTLSATGDGTINFSSVDLGTDTYTSIENLSGGGNDTINGGDDNNTIVGGAGADTLDGGAGDDFLSYFFSTGVTVDLTTGLGTAGEAAGDIVSNFEILDGSNTNGDTLTGRAGTITVNGFGGNDLLIIASASPFAAATTNTLNGGSGVDTLSFENGSIPLLLGSFTFTLDNSGNGSIASLSNISLTDVIYTSIENIIGRNVAGFADIINGNGGDNLIEGLKGDDQLNGFSGNDTLNGGDGADTLDGSFGTDTLNGGAGDDILQPGQDLQIDIIDGGDGTGDWLSYQEAGLAFGVIAALTGGLLVGAEDANVSNVENLRGTNQNDVLFGDDGVNTIEGLNGGDTIVGRGGADTLNGGAGADVFTYNATSDSTAFVFDTILGFSTVDDKIDLANIDAFITTAGNQGFAFISQANIGLLHTFAEASVAEVWAEFEPLSGSTFIYIDFAEDGNFDADMAIYLASGNYTSSLAAANFDL